MSCIMDQVQFVEESLEKFGVAWFVKIDYFVNNVLFTV